MFCFVHFPFILFFIYYFIFIFLFFVLFCFFSFIYVHVTVFTYKPGHSILSLYIRVCNKKYFPLSLNQNICNGYSKIQSYLGVFCENPKQMLNFQPKVKLWTRKRSVSMRRLFCALKTNVQTDCMILFNSCAPREV